MNESEVSQKKGGTLVSPTPSNDRWGHVGRCGVQLSHSTNVTGMESPFPSNVIGQDWLVTD
jgi:hypothetical protein